MNRRVKPAWSVVAASGQWRYTSSERARPHRKQEAGGAPREGDHRHLLSATVRNRVCPGAQASGLRVRGSTDAPGRLDQERLHVRMCTAQDTAAVLVLAGAVLARHET